MHNCIALTQPFPFRRGRTSTRTGSSLGLLTSRISPVHCTLGRPSESLADCSRPCCRGAAPLRTWQNTERHGGRFALTCGAAAPDTSYQSWPPPEGPGDFDYDELSPEEVQERVWEAAEYICLLEELRPLQRDTFNAFYEVWRRIARIPPEQRVRLLSELEPGAIRSLWKLTMSRYVLDEERSLQLFADYNITCDFPTETGELYTYEGRCEAFVYRPPASPFQVDPQLQRKQPRAVPWLRPSPGSWQFPQEAFRMRFWVSPTTRHLLCHTAIQLRGPLYRAWLPCYARVDVGLTLTPLQADAGADLVLRWPDKDELPVLGREELPPGPWWPVPRAGAWSPFSLGPRDYVRVAGPGVYVGCAYRRTGPGELLEDDFIYFVIVRTQ